MLSKETTQSLQKILKEDYKQDISLEEASDIANTLVNYFDLLIKISRNNNKDKSKNENDFKKIPQKK